MKLAQRDTRYLIIQTNLCDGPLELIIRQIRYGFSLSDVVSIELFVSL